MSHGRLRAALCALALAAGAAPALAGMPAHDAAAAQTAAARNGGRAATPEILRDLTIQTTGGGIVNWGAQLILHLSSSNLGPGGVGLGSATVLDNLPAGLTLTSWSAAGWMCMTPDQTVICNYNGAPIGVGSLPTINLTVKAVGEGALQNCAIIQSNGMNEPSLANNTSCVSVIVHPKPR